MMENIERLLSRKDRIDMPDKASFNHRLVILDGTREACEAQIAEVKAGIAVTG